MPIRLEKWLKYLKISGESIDVLGKFATKIEPHLDAVLDVFYAHIQTSEAARKLFNGPQAVARARQAQRRHWLTYVLAGKFDADYMRAATMIGQTHYRIGVDHMVYGGAYSVMLNELTPLILTLYQDDPKQGVTVLRAVNQAVFLDLGLATSVYYDSAVSALEEMSNELNFSLAKAGEFRDNETGMHLIRMSRMCRAVAAALGQDQKWAQMIQNASPLHDVGKIGIPDNILLKPGRLDPAEMEIMRRHPIIGGEIVPDHPAEPICMAKTIALTHHERWDGTGYPRGLKGEEIPLEGRIAAICDVYDALLSERPYKRPWPRDKAIAHIIGNSGTHFDPAVVEAFVSILPEIESIQAKFEDDSGILEYALV